MTMRSKAMNNSPQRYHFHLWLPGGVGLVKINLVVGALHASASLRSIGGVCGDLHVAVSSRGLGVLVLEEGELLHHFVHAAVLLAVLLKLIKEFKWARKTYLSQNKPSVWL
jgi:hypothetical protein